jgi:response regulator RpfG family c-di-GMP phosphodiesterase
LGKISKKRCTKRQQFPAFNTSEKDYTKQVKRRREREILERRNNLRFTRHYSDTILAALAALLCDEWPDVESNLHCLRSGFFVHRLLHSVVVSLERRRRIMAVTSLHPVWREKNRRVQRCCYVSRE